MKQYKVIIIYVIFDDISRKSFEEELEKYGHSCISPWQYNHVIQRS